MSCNANSATLSLAITDPQFPDVPGFPYAGIPYEIDITQGNSTLLGPGIIFPGQTSNVDVQVNYAQPLVIRTSQTAILDSTQEKVALGFATAVSYLFDYFGIGGDVFSSTKTSLQKLAASEIEKLIVKGTGQATVGAFVALEQGIADKNPGAVVGALPDLIKTAPQWLGPLLTQVGGQSSAEAASVVSQAASLAPALKLAIFAGKALGMVIVNQELSSGASGSTQALTTISTPQSQPSTSTPPVIDGPGAVSAPGPDLTGPIVFSWTPSPGATGYAMYISQAPYGQAHLVFDESQLSGTADSWTLPTGLLPPGSYRWNLEAFTPGGTAFSVGNLYFQVPASSMGNLSIDLTGLPGDVATPIRLTGPHVSGSASFTAGTVPFDYLAPGSYTIATAYVKAHGLTYSPTVASQTVTVAAGQTASTSIAYCESPTVNVIVNGSCLASHATPVVQNGRTLVALPAVATALGVRAQWNAATKTITIVSGDQSVRVVVGQTYVDVHGSRVSLDVPVQIIRGVPFVSLRFVSVVLGAHTSWNPALELASITSVPTATPHPEVTAVSATFSAGNGFALAVASKGTVVGWGTATSPLAGISMNAACDAVIPCQTLPVPIPSVPSSKEVVAGGSSLPGRYGLALTDQGTVWAWGADDDGQLGDEGNAMLSRAPIEVSGLANITQIAAGNYGAIALASGGTVYAWGSLSEGLTGQTDWPMLGTTLLASGPVAGLPGGMTSIAAGGATAAAVAKDGSLWVWGDNVEGEQAVPQPDGGCGFGSLYQFCPSSPHQVAGLPAIASVAVGQDFVLALAADGTVWAWGDDASGQLGPETVTGECGLDACSDTPVKIAGLSDVVAIAAGASYGLALRSDGTVWTWDAHGIYVTPGLSHIVAISAGSDVALAQDESGALWAWGSGMLGNGLYGSDVDSSNFGAATNSATRPVRVKLP